MSSWPFMNSSSKRPIFRNSSRRTAAQAAETGRQVAPLALKRLQTRLVDALLEDGWPVTLSMGAAIFLYPPESVDELIKSADRLMFLAKNEGKNTVQYKIYTSPGVNPESLPPEDSSTHSLQSAAQSSDLPAV